MPRDAQAHAAGLVGPVVVAVSADEPARFPFSIRIVPPLRVHPSRGRQFKARAACRAAHSHRVVLALP